MISRKIETLVGLFVLVGIVGIAYMAINLGGVSLSGSKQYTLFARFNSIGNLNSGASVRIAGVSIGEVTGVELDPQDFVAIVELKVSSEFKFDDDTIASIKSSGLIGDKYIELSPGGSGIIMEPGDMIIDTESALDLESLISRFAFGGVEKD